MANKSNWKGTETKAARLFPGGKRRLRVGGGTYSVLADDVVFGLEFNAVKDGKPCVMKLPLPNATGAIIPPVFIECKKRAAVQAVSEFKKAEEKYLKLYAKPVGAPADANLVMVFHVLRQQHQFVMVSDEFFSALFKAWLDHNQVLLTGE